MAVQQQEPAPLILTNFTFETFEIPSEDRLGNCRSIQEFERLQRIGQGSYGVVNKAKDKSSGAIYAVKRLRRDDAKDGIAINVLREVRLLSELWHENVIRFREVAIGNDFQMFLVMECCKCDLAQLLVSRVSPLSPSEVKCLMLQLLRGLEFLHRNCVVHRDIKASNLLLTETGVLKIGDFGLARTYSVPLKPMTPDVVTLQYRAPELLFRSPEQTAAIDMWATGCIFGEMLLSEPLFAGKSELSQINLIIDLLGTPTEDIWPGLSSLPIMANMNLRDQPFNNLKRRFTSLSENGLRLMHFLFMYDPRQRATAAECLQSTFFREHPKPCEPSSIHLPAS